MAWQKHKKNIYDYQLSLIYTIKQEELIIKGISTFITDCLSYTAFKNANGRGKSFSV